jgi:hypothetical protein
MTTSNMIAYAAFKMIEGKWTVQYPIFCADITGWDNAEQYLNIQRIQLSDSPVPTELRIVNMGEY